MPRNRNSDTPPKVMSWPEATPVLVVAGFFDLVRLFFQFFWFFGPALAAAYCTAQVGDVAAVGKLLAAGCVLGAGAAGYFASPAITMFGVLMADAAGLAAFLFLGLLLLSTNARLFKVNRSVWLWLTGSLGIGVIPFIGAFPIFTVALRALYKRQIKVEAAARGRWMKERGETQFKEQRQEQLMQAQSAGPAATDVY